MRFRILGPVRAEADGTEVSVTAGRDRLLLGILLLYANQHVSAGRLIDEVWPDGPPSGARNQLHGCVSRLRKRLGSDVIVTEPDGYRLVVNPGDVDLLEFRRLVGEARAAVSEHRYDDAVASFRTALGLWRGPALAGLDGHAVVRAAAALDEERVQALEERLAAELAGGAGGELVAELMELVGQHPLREGVHGALMLALYRAGRQADALATYRDARQMLLDELGIEPGSQLRELHQAILNGEPTLDQPAPEPLLPSAPRPRQLPLDVAGFSGRAEALKALDDSLKRRPNAAVVIFAIAGTAGVGKTALAVHWAHRVADHFPDGQIFIDLRGYATSPPMSTAEALTVLLRSLGTPSQEIPSDVDEAARLYRTLLADRRLLVVLDNAASPDQVRLLLPGGAACQVIVTSRDRLSGLVAREGARPLILDVLTPVEANELLTNMLGAERIDAERDAAKQLARACAYLPLAIRIAVANILAQPDWTIASYVRELLARDRLSMLQADGDEQNAVGTAFDLSYQHLTNDAQRMFRMLAVVPGPDFAPDAAAVLANVSRDDAERQMDRLVRASLLHRRPGGRYSFHDLLRVYALHCLHRAEDVPERHAAFRRLTRWYVDMTGVAHDAIHPQYSRLPPSPGDGEATDQAFRDAATALDWLELERPNLVAAVLYAADHKEYQLSWLLADRLRGYLLRSRYLADLRSVADAALGAAQAVGDPAAQAVMQLATASIHRYRGEHTRALTHYDTALEFANRAGWTAGEATVLTDMSAVYWVRGQLREAASRLTRALALSRQTGVASLEANVLINLGIIYQELGQLSQAAEFLAQALKLSRKVGVPGSEGVALHNLGEVCYDLGIFREAESHLTEALAKHRQVGNRSGVASCLSVIAGLRRDQGRLADAQTSAQEALEEARAIGDPHDEPEALNALGSTLAQIGHFEQAAACHQQALDAARQTSDRALQVRALLGLATVGWRLGEMNAASRQGVAALDIARDAQYLLLEGLALTLLAQICLVQGRYDEAGEHAEHAIDNHRTTGHRLGEARTLYVLGRLRQAAGQHEAATEVWREAGAIFDEIGAKPPDDLPISQYGT